MESGGAPDLERIIRNEIESSGPMPFARFMDLCLYHPTLGYYSRGLGGGGGRDYITSSGLHRAYGALLARQAEEMWRLAGRPHRYQFVEFGPGEGHFACDFLRAADASAEFARALQYVLVESSPALRSRQQERLGCFAGGAKDQPYAPVWVNLADLERAGVAQGCLFANEVLDAFPVHRVIATPLGPREMHVEVAGGALRSALAPLSTPELDLFLGESEIRLQEGQEVDLCLASPRFVARLAALLERGYLVIVDYGYLAADLYHAGRRRGTLLAYHHHRVSEDFLARPGEQDLTAHVDFTAVARAAEGSGMRVAGLTSQARFLLALGALESLEGSDVAGREALKEMVLPDRMGGVFRVLMLVKGELPATLRGLSTPWAEQVPA